MKKMFYATKIISMILSLVPSQMIIWHYYFDNMKMKSLIFLH